jgi:DNA processing protein
MRTAPPTSDRAPSVDGGDQARVLEALGPAPVAIDQLARATGLPIRAVQIVLMELSLASRVVMHGANSSR